MSERLRVNEKLVEPRIAGATDDTRAQLFEFGELMIGEVLARTASLDSKAQNVIGWTSALLALLLAGRPLRILRRKSRVGGWSLSPSGRSALWWGSAPALSRCGLEEFGGRVNRTGFEQTCSRRPVCYGPT